MVMLIVCRNFVHFLVKCESITQSNQWNPLETPNINCMLLSKLSGNLKDTWVGLVMKVRRKEQREATLCDFIDFISEETMLVNNPLFSKEAIEPYNEKRSNRQENAKKKISTFITSLKKDDITGLHKVEMPCSACGKSYISIPVNKDIEGENEAFGKRKVFLCLLPANEQEP